MNIEEQNKRYEFLDLSLDSGVLMLVVDKPRSLNALDTKLLEELDDCLSSLRQQKDSVLKGMIFTGSGEKAFIAGADIKEMSVMGTLEAEKFAVAGQKVTLLLEDLPFPVIAAVNGFALGGGCEMAMSADFIFATKNAVFGQPEVRLGLIPGFGGTQRLAKIVGRNKAKEIIYSGRNVSVEEAHELGLVLRIYDKKSEMIKGANELLDQIAQNSPLAVSRAKKVMNRGNDLTVPNGLEVESEQFALLFASEDMKEGTEAFLDKRSPDFKGK
tara:strand:+ start:1104 stop:1916 length:813 start_codon:yes stop_codon:yes gene_type:complete